jgi:hypothetical protein
MVAPGASLGSVDERVLRPILGCDTKSGPRLASEAAKQIPAKQIPAKQEPPGNGSPAAPAPWVFRLPAHHNPPRSQASSSAVKTTCDSGTAASNWNRSSKSPARCN